MDTDWVTSPHGRRALVHWVDQRPAWLWLQDGNTLVWQNRASLMFGAKVKKHGLKLAEPAAPIKGQVARVLRLGSSGRTSLSRIQFLAGSKPVSATCACTPLLLANGQQGLLIVGVDPITPEVWAAASALADPGGMIFPAGVAFQLVAPGAANELAEGTTSLAAGSDGWRLVLGRGAEIVAEAPPALAPAPVIEEPAVAGIEPAAEEPFAPAAADVDTEAEAPLPSILVTEDDTPITKPAGRLSGLLQQLVDDADLFSPLDARDDAALHAPVPEQTEGSLDDVRSALEELVANEEPPRSGPTLFRVTGRSFRPHPVAAVPIVEIEPEAEPIIAPAIGDVSAAPVVNPEPAVVEAAAAEPGVSDEPIPAPADSVEKASRYNFDELTRLLNERVNGDARKADAPEPQLPASQPSGSLVNLGGETLVLNRLPLGILVFRDQQVLFANRAITEMTGFPSVEALRTAGLSAIFPANDDGQQSGPVNHLVQRDGTLVPVTARLQSISWQGKPALMLSASATEVRTGHEAAVRAFAEALADTRRDGFIEANRNGVVSLISAQARKALDRGDESILGKPLSALIDPEDLPDLRTFLERPARFAETARPCIAVRALGGGTDILLFAQGQAGIVTGYFGFVHPRDAALPATSPEDPEGFDTTLLARLSRGVRRPLNTIIGFSDLISSSAFGPIENARYLEYARDIRAAGQDIAALVDELEDYARLRDGRYVARHANVDIATLLETCVARVLKQAGTSRVLVRSAISGRLPKVTADRASLTQAVLNLLASAIDQTPAGGAVILSAQREEDGSVSIHVRDSAAPAPDQADRFVVFRDGVGKDGTALAPVRSSVGLALTRSLVAVNAFTLSVEPSTINGTLFSLSIPSQLVGRPDELDTEAD